MVTVEVYTGTHPSSLISAIIDGMRVAGSNFYLDGARWYTSKPSVTLIAQIPSSHASNCHITLPYIVP